MGKRVCLNGGKGGAGACDPPPPAPRLLLLRTRVCSGSASASASTGQVLSVPWSPPVTPCLTPSNAYQIMTRDGDVRRALPTTSPLEDRAHAPVAPKPRRSALRHTLTEVPSRPFSDSVSLDPADDPPRGPRPLHARTQSCPTQRLPEPTGFAFSYPPGPGAPEVQFCTEVGNPWQRQAVVAEPGRFKELRDPQIVPCESDAATGCRRFQALCDEANARVFQNNAVRTTKYSPWTFVFYNLYNQFRNLSNVYFLFISILQFLPVSSVGPTTWFPLSLVLIANMVKEALEDIGRKRMDEELNERTVDSVNAGAAGERVVAVCWEDVSVGRVLLVREDEALPADVIVLATSDEKGGLAYIETSQLDGETNLKHRESLQVVHGALLERGAGPGMTSEGVGLLQRVWVECERPNDRLHNFTGTLRLGDAQAPVTNKQVIYRGCYLRNTAWVFGLVVYTGMDTKLMRNAKGKRFKTTSLDKLSNRYVVGVFWFLGVMCVLGGALSAAFILSHPTVPWYLQALGHWLEELLYNSLTFLILLSYLVPISLSITAEVVKLGHAYFIDHDLGMCYYDAATGAHTPAQARTSNLSEDLGRVAYVFTDKTGTLTRNVMEFMKCSVNGVRYGRGLTEIGQAALDAGDAGALCLSDDEGPDPPGLRDMERPKGLRLEQGNNFWDPRVSDNAWQQLPEPQRTAVETFFVHLAVCHTLIAKLREPGAEWAPGAVQYQASSPDELALALGAKGAGFWFKRRAGALVEVVVGAQERAYAVLNVCEFNSSRKRMSCVVQGPGGGLTLLCKGADSVIYSLLAPEARDAAVCERTLRHLSAFASEGLRTLVLAQRELDPEWYRGWNQRYVRALTATVDRDERLHEVAVEIETGLRLVGATAIEDKLQEGVPQALANLLTAGIKVWMLTGDKVETAMNIALACNLLQPHMRTYKIVEDEGQADGSVSTMEQVLKAADAIRSGEDVAIVIDGVALEAVIQDEYHVGMDVMGKFLEVATRCRAVVCCRVSPKQKAEVVHLVRKKEHVICVSIGDGANDVPMILNANIGIGISGQEGMQAVMASDYAIAQFRYIQRLLLVHGRWSCQRLCVLIVYFFYKNCNIALVSFWYGLYSEFSGVRFWNDLYGTVWNCFFTAFPIFCTGLLNRDVVSPSTLLTFADLYKEVQGGQDFTIGRFFWWMMDAVFVSLVVFFVPLYAVGGASVWPSGQMHGKWVFSLTSYWCLHLVTNLRLCMVTRTWTKWSAFVMCLTIFLFFPFSWCFALLPPHLTGTMYGSLHRTMRCAAFWLSSLLSAVICLLPAFVQMSVNKIFRPSNTQRVAEQEKEMMRCMSQSGEYPTEEAVRHAYQTRRRGPAAPASPADAEDVSGIHLQEDARGRASL